MPQLTLSEKFDVLLANIMAYPLFLIIFGIPLIAFLIGKTKLKKGAIITYLIGTIVVLAINFSQLPALLDNLVEYVISIMNFPTIGIILGIVILEIVIILMSFIKNYRRIVKVINSLGFVLVQLLFAVALQIISKNDMNVSTVQNLSASLDLMVLLQMIMLTFGLQLGLLLVSKLIDMVTNYLDNTSKEKVLVQAPAIQETKKIDYKDVINPLKTVLTVSKDKVKEVIVAITNNIQDAKDKKQALLLEKDNKKSLESKNIITVEPAKETLLDVTLEPEKNNDLSMPQSSEFTYGTVNPVKISEEIVKEDKEISVGDAKEKTFDIEEIASRVNSIEMSNRFITESTRKQMEEELLLYKEQLLIYRQEVLKKQELAKKQEVDFNNIFNISYDDLRKDY